MFSTIKLGISNASRFLSSINYVQSLMTIGIPVLGILLAPSVPLQPKTLFWSCIYWFLGGMGITAGYHRLWSHKSYTASLPLQILLALLGAGAVQGSIRKWSRDHRAHHRYVDTDQDPYCVIKGFWHAHMGWIIFRQDHTSIGRVDISDLNTDKVVMWQHQYYVRLMALMGFFFPTLVAGCGWGDWKGGFVYSALLRIAILQQNTYCINSVAHWLGDQPYQSTKTPKDNLFAAILTLGEGYHNFHHEFPSDYRNGRKTFDFDPTKWFINLLAWASLVSGRNAVPENEIRMSHWQEKYKSLVEESNGISWGVPDDHLPTMSMAEMQTACEMGAEFICIDEIVHDISKFKDEHPGGSVILRGIGTDASEMFNGSIYQHSQSARNRLLGMRKARIEKSAQQLALDDRWGCLDFRKA